MSKIIFNAVRYWLLFIVVAIINGAIREQLFAPWLGQQFALPLSGILLSGLIFLITFFIVPFLRISIRFHYWIVGGLWVFLTVSFELVFGHYVMGTSWSNLIGAYNVLKGNLWVLVIITTALSPYLAAKLRGLV